MTTVRLSNGAHMPLMGFGTSRLNGDICAKAVKEALDAGVRHIDCAKV